MAKITYADTPVGRSVNVYLDGKLVGTIKPDGNGFRYYPKGSRVPGDRFSSVERVKRSLEAGD